MGQMKNIMIDMMNEDWERCHLMDEIYRMEWRKEMEMQMEKELQEWLNRQPANIETYDNKEVSENPGAGIAPGFVHGTGVRSGEGGHLPTDGVYEVRGLSESTGEQGLRHPDEGWEIRGHDQRGRYVQGSLFPEGDESREETKSPASE